MAVRKLLGTLCLTLTLALAVVFGCERFRARKATTGGEAPTGAAAASVKPPRQHIERLENGLRVIVRERRLGGMAAFRVYVGAGSLNEGDFSGAGVSHFLEHLVSGGTTPTRSEDEIRQALQTIGAQTNAHTSKQFVCYHGQVGGEHIGRLIEIIGDYVIHAQIEQKEFDREFEVVQREIERSLADPHRRLWQLANETFFTDHPARQPILGHPDAFRELKRDDMVRFYRRIVVPDNTVVVAVGDFDADVCLETIRKTFGSWKRRRFQPTVLPPRKVQTGPRHATLDLDVKSVRTIIEFPTVRLTDPDLYPLDILAFVLGHGRASRMVSDIRDRRGLVQSISVSSYTPAGYDGGRFATMLEAQPDKADAARKAVMEQLARAVREPPTDEELARAKRQKISAHVFGLEQVENIATDMGLNALLVGDPDFSERYVRHIQKVTAADVQRVAAKYLRPEVVTVTTARPKREVKAEDATKPPVKPPAVRPRIIHRLLPNGVRLLLCPIPGHPTVSIKMLMRGGLSVESEKTAGISSFMSRMLMKGAKRHTTADIARILDAMGARMSATSGRNTLYLSARCLAEDFDTTFDLAAECLLEPAFPPEEIERLRAMTLAQLAHMADTPHGEASLYFNRVFFTNSPYRFPVPGTPEVVKSLTRDALLAWHRKYVVGSNLVVAVFGGIDLVKAAKRVAAAVENLPQSPRLLFPKDIKPRKTTGREVYIKASGKGSAIVYVAHPGFDIFNVRDRFAVEMLDTVMSGYRMPSGWLHAELRGKGLVYEVHAWSMAGLRPGYFAAMAVCQPEKVPEVVGIIEKATERARKETFTEDQLTPARACIITAKELGRETIDGWSFEAAVDEVLGLGHAFAREELQRIRQTRPDDLSRVARRYLKKPVIVVVTSDPKAAEAIRK
jgi:zinc protease